MFNGYLHLPTERVGFQSPCSPSNKQLETPAKSNSTELFLEMKIFTSLYFCAFFMWEIFLIFSCIFLAITSLQFSMKTYQTSALRYTWLYIKNNALVPFKKCV